MLPAANVAGQPNDRHPAPPWDVVYFFFNYENKIFFIDK